MTSEDLLERCRRAVANGRRHGANAVEVFGQTVESVNATVEKHDLQISKSQIETSFGVRAFVSKRVGFASTNAPSRIDAICQEAITLAAASPEDPHNVLPKSVETEPIDGLYDPAAASFEATDAVHRTAEILDRVEAIDRRVIVNDAWFEAQRAEIAVANSEGLAVRELGSLFTYGLVATARDRERVSSFDVQSDASRTVAGIDLERPIARACENALASLGAAVGESFRGTVLLAPRAVADLVVGPVLFQLNARNVLRGRSRWKDFIGRAVAATALSVVDDGRKPGGVATSAFDREGVPHRKAALLEDGVAASLLHNTYTAGALGESNTGHAAGSARSVPAIGPTNLSILPGEPSVEDLIGEVQRGLLVRRFSGNTDPVSGDFSGAAKSAWLIRNGKLDRPVSGTMIAGNLFEILKHLSGVSAVSEPIFSYTLPTLRLERVSVTT